MKLCTCPRIGLVPTGEIDARCPVHRVPDPQPARIMTELRKAPAGGLAAQLVPCSDCGRAHPDELRCDFVDET